MSTLGTDTDTDIKFKTRIERTKREANKRQKILYASWTTKATNECVSKEAYTDFKIPSKESEKK